MNKIKALLTSCLLFSVTSHAALISSYDFNGTLTDTLGNGAQLIDNGGVINAGRYDFGLGQGLAFDVSSLFGVNDSYAIEMRFKSIDGWSGYNRLIDWSDLNSDYGLYVYNNTATIYDSGSRGPASFINNKDITLGFEYNSLTQYGNLYLNGSHVGGWLNNGSFDLDSNLNHISFFEDDKYEEFTGSVDFIRFHDDASTFSSQPSVQPISSPTTIAIFAFSLMALSLRRIKV